MQSLLEYTKGKRYRLIYADPPWSYRNVKTGGSLKSGAAQKYPVMSVDEIASLPVPAISMRDSVLFLWATVPLLPEALHVMKSWGFEYKTAFFWKKKSFGLGYWFRGVIEVCLIGIKGNIKPFRMQIPNFIETKPGRHSEKPKEMYVILEKLNLNPKIELFARERRAGWDAWGLEVPDTIQKTLI